MTRILLAVNDSPAGLAAVRTALRFARASRGTVLAVHVLTEEPPAAGAGGSGGAAGRSGRSSGSGGPGGSGGAAPVEPGPAAATSPERAADALLDYITELARESGVPIETRRLAGRPAQVILDQAARWEPDVIVLGRSGVRHVGQPFVGSQVLHVIEFSDVPVLVVPAA
jgi:nucleotide-binding universal stress UspA family protein